MHSICHLKLRGYLSFRSVLLKLCQPRATFGSEKQLEGYIVGTGICLDPVKFPSHLYQFVTKISIYMAIGKGVRGVLKEAEVILPTALCLQV